MPLNSIKLFYGVDLSTPFIERKINMKHIKEIGKLCKRYRQYIGYTQEQVAKELRCSSSNISAFERGKINNMEILFWYIEKGLDLEQIK